MPNFVRIDDGISDKKVFVVVNFDALAQASDIRIERRQFVFLCWMQDSNRTQAVSGPESRIRRWVDIMLININQ